MPNIVTVVIEKRVDRSGAIVPKKHRSAIKGAIDLRLRDAVRSRPRGHSRVAGLVGRTWHVATVSPVLFVEFSVLRTAANVAVV